MKKYFYLIFSVLIVAANIFIPACGSKSNNNSSAVPVYPATGVACIPGQACTTLPGGGVVGGVSLLPAPAVATNFDTYGSTLALNFLGQQVIAGTAGYTGAVTIQGVLTIAAPPGSCPGPGQYTVQGQGTYQSGYGGAIAGVGGTLQLIGQNGASGTATLDPSLVESVVAGTYRLSMQLEIPSCNRIVDTPY